MEKEKTKKILTGILIVLAILLLCVLQGYLADLYLEYYLSILVCFLLGGLWGILGTIIWCRINE